MNKQPLCIILGAGAGLGSSLATTFSKAGYKTVAINRSTDHLSTLDNTIEIHSLDLSDVGATTKTLNNIINEYGAPEVVIHNCASLTIKPFLETSDCEYEESWRSMSQSLFNAMQVLLPGMVKIGKGCVLVSGATASIRGGNKFSAFASAKFALRGLTQSLAREFQDQGIHIAHILLDGIIDTPRSRDLHSLDSSKMLKPDDLAEQYLNLVNQPESVWVHEMDMRPHSESF